MIEESNGVGESSKMDYTSGEDIPTTSSKMDSPMDTASKIETDEVEIDLSDILKKLEALSQADQLIFKKHLGKTDPSKIRNLIIAWKSTEEQPGDDLEIIEAKINLSDTQKKAIDRLKALRADGFYDIDYRTLLPSQPQKSRAKTFLENFHNEQQWISKEQRVLEKWQKKMARKLAVDCSKKVNEKLKSEEVKEEKEKNYVKKGAAKVAGIIQEFWWKVNRATQYYEMQLIEDAKQKRLESTLMNVIDRSSTLTEIMTPGAKKAPKAKEDIIEDLGNDPEDMEAFLAMLPPEYLAEIEASNRKHNVIEDEPEPSPERRISPRRRSSSKSPAKSLPINGIKESELPLKVNNGFAEKRRSKRLSMSPPVAKKAKMDLESTILEESQDTSHDTLPHDESTDPSPKPPEPPKNALDDAEMNDLAKVAESFQPTGNTYETAKSLRTAVPSILNATLREYQHIGLDWLASLFDNKLNGILADEMGLGKTVQTISFLAHLAENKKIWGPHLIVVPTSVLLNWEREFKRFCPSLKVLTYFGSTKERSEKRKGWKKPNSFNVCITSYDLYIRDTRMFKWRAWQCLVLDEAHNIKNSKSLRWNKLLSLRTRIRLLLTGTPLQNNLMELWSLLYFLMPSVFASQEDFKNWFNDPMSAMIEGSAEYNSQIVEKLHTVLRPFILRRLKSEVEKQMPKKLERVIFCPLARIQRNMYNQFIRKKSTIDSIRGGAARSVLNIVMQLRKCCNHPNLFYPITCTAPTALPRLALQYPQIFNEIEESTKNENEALTFLKLMKSDFLDEDNRLLPLVSSIFFKPQIRTGYAKSTIGFINLQHQTLVTKLKVESQNIPEITSKKMQWLWRITKPIRDDIYTTHDALETNLYEPLENHIRKICEKNVRRYAFPTSPVYAFHPRCSLTPAPTPTSEAVCDKLFKGEDELVSYVHYSTPIQYPDAKLVELDCGKLRLLAKLLRELNQGGHRCLIFTQMTKMLDILEVFLVHQKYPYFRLDGSTNVQQRQVLMDRFNADDRIFAFILSTRSGGIGINLTGADTVIFYDSDWNPQGDAQAQDRCHRIGQTRNVLIYRLISSHTIEENILKKAMHKRRLGEMTLDEGEFNAKFFEKSNVRDLFEGEEALQDALDDCDFAMTAKEMEKVMYQVEDSDDVEAAQALKSEIGEDEPEAPDDFKEAILSELSPIERFAFMTYLDEKMPEISERVKYVVGKMEEDDEVDPLESEVEDALNSDDEDDATISQNSSSNRSTPLPPPSIKRKLPQRGSNGSTPAASSPATRSKRVRFTGLVNHQR